MASRAARPRGWTFSARGRRAAASRAAGRAPGWTAKTGSAWRPGSGAGRRSEKPAPPGGKALGLGAGSGGGKAPGSDRGKPALAHTAGPSAPPVHCAGGGSVRRGTPRSARRQARYAAGLSGSRPSARSASRSAQVRSARRSRTRSARMMRCGRSHPTNRTRFIGCEPTAYVGSARLPSAYLSRLHRPDAAVERAHEVYEGRPKHSAHVPQFQRVQPPGAQFILGNPGLRAFERGCNIGLAQALLFPGFAQAKTAGFPASVCWRVGAARSAP